MRRSPKETHCILSLTLTIKSRRNAQNLDRFLLVHASLLDKICLAVEDIVRPSIRGILDQLQFLLQIRQSLRVVFLQCFVLHLQRGMLLGQFRQARQFDNTVAALILATAFRIREFRRRDHRLLFQDDNIAECCLVLKLQHAVLFGWKRPEIVAAANFVLVDESIVNESLIDIQDTVLVDEQWVSANVENGRCGMNCLKCSIQS